MMSLWPATSSAPDPVLVVLVVLVTTLLLACSAAGPAKSEDTQGSTGIEDSTTLPPVTCPPPEPTGLGLGERAADVSMTDCRGEPRSLHGLCGAPALVVGWYGWCPSCQRNGELAESLGERWPGLQSVLALEEDPLAAPVSAELCVLEEEAMAGPAALWMDPEKRMTAYGGTDLVLLLERDGTITFLRETSDSDVISAAVDELMGRQGLSAE